MPQSIQVKLDKRSYFIHIGMGYLKHAIEDLENIDEVALVTDWTVEELEWFMTIEAAFRGKASKYIRCVIQAGEESKSLATYTMLCSKLAKANLSRKCVVVALGGGVIGDIAGFLASTYLRGVRLIQIPTTLLAAVDSSVGGKTGVNLPEGKNLVGSFYQPSEVLMDVDLLDTLPERELANGMAEVVKYGLIRDPKLLDGLEKGHTKPLSKIIARCVQIKADVVGKDERDVSGERAILNFGHTIGHAIEKTTGYGKWLHGEAISVGMVAACMLSQKLFGLPKETTQRIKKILKLLNLPVHAPEMDEPKILEAIGHDKKSTGHKIQWVLLSDVGKTKLSTDVSTEDLHEVIQACRVA